MNREIHLAIGILAFFLYAFLIGIVNKGANYSFWYGLIAAAIGSLLPDIIEPGTSWTHRGKCHSKRALKFTGVVFVISAVIGLFFSFITNYSLFYLISCFFLGYVFHLLADSTTKMGLPG
jgi:membrane-bound metal-dependent hydrolase YbcI (DUF457 family)